MTSPDRDDFVFQTPDGEYLSAGDVTISVELEGDAASLFDPEFIQDAAAGVLHYFRTELGRKFITVAEFSLALEKTLRGFKLGDSAPDAYDVAPRIIRSDLRKLAVESGHGCELLFFPRLREELREQLRHSPQTLCFQGLRQSVKQLAGARRWTARCQELHDQIVDYLRSCLSQEGGGTSCALVVS